MRRTIFLRGAALSLAIACRALEPARSLVVPLLNTSGDRVGEVTFRQTIDKKLDIDITLVDVSAGDHAVHIHENPVCDGGRDFKTAGGHFNPQGKQHGTLNPLGHHAGDLPYNVTVAPETVRPGNYRLYGHINLKVQYLSLVAGAPNSILGRSIVVHDRADDMKTDPGGGAGNRIACGVIGMAGQQ